MIPSRPDHHGNPTPDLRHRRVAQANSRPGEVRQLLYMAVVAAIMAMSARSIQWLRSDRRIPYRKVGHLVRFDQPIHLAWAMSTGLKEVSVSAMSAAAVNGRAG
jgi:hypothetical protein